MLPFIGIRFLKVNFKPNKCVLTKLNLFTILSIYQSVDEKGAAQRNWSTYFAMGGTFC